MQGIMQNAILNGVSLEYVFARFAASSIRQRPEQGSQAVEQACGRSWHTHCCTLLNMI
jgi:hypothetical protein